MSAYSASAPVTASTTDPSETNAWCGSLMMNCAAYVGERQRKIPALLTMLWRPRTAIVVNQMPIAGPNSTPTLPVPNRWMQNSTVSTASEIGITSLDRLGDATFRPSTADSTEIAGVIIPSP